MVGHKMLYSLCQLQIVSDDLQDKPCETLLVSPSNASIPLTSNFNVFYKYRDMAIHVPGIMYAKQILRQAKLIVSQGVSTSKVVPKGHFAVYVGENQKKRFVIPVSFLNQPSFQELLSKAEEEFGFDHPMGGLTIPCREDIFINVTSSLNES
ncbi:hypothetical protein WN943_024908 [Citrus x changshan-huyou]